MTLLVAYMLLTLLVLSWIVWDAETVYVFDVFGKSFYYVWVESGKRWTCLSSYGWRLLTLCTVIVSNAALSFLFFMRNAAQLGTGMCIIVLGIMLAGSFVPIPWIYLANRLRWQRSLRSTASQPLGFINRVNANRNIGQFLEPADYSTREPWTAWHPSREEWTQPYWSDIVPVAYFQNPAIQSAVFCTDFDTFLGWKIPACLIDVNSDLPFHGPNDCSFRVRGVKPLGGYPDWSVISVDYQSEPIDVGDGRG